MRVEADPAFAEIVVDKMNEGRRLPGCINPFVGLNGVLKEWGEFLDPDTLTLHTIIRQPQSHVVESPNPANLTEIGEGVCVSVNPQRLLIEKNGLLSLLTTNSTLSSIDPNAIRRTRESVLRSEPILSETVREVEVKSLEDQISEINSTFEPKTIQRRLFELLRSGLFSRRYVRVSYFEDEGLGDSNLAFVRASFRSGQEVTGEVANLIDTTKGSRCFIHESIELSLDFDELTSMETLDGNHTGVSFDMSVEGDNIRLARENLPAGFTHLGISSLETVSEIVNNAELIPYK